MIRFLLHFLLSAFILFSVFFFQNRLDRIPGSTNPIDDLKYIPSGKFLKGAALSYDEVVADLLWIKAIGYFGEHAKIDRDYTWLYHILDVTTTLDPFFDDPYEFGGITLATELGNIEQSNLILKKGMQNVPQKHKRYWYLPFFTAFNYMYYKDDFKTAAHYLEIAASFPQRPPYLPLLVARLYANTDDPGIALPFLEEMLNKTSSPEMQENLKKRIKDIQLKQHILFLTAASEQFYKRTERYPTHLKELLDKEIIKILPIEPFGGQYQILENGSVISTSKSDSMELHINSLEQNNTLQMLPRKPQ